MMKTTIYVSDSLLMRAKRHARWQGRTLRALVEEGLRRVLDEDTNRPPYELPDCSVGEPHGDNPLGRRSWSDLRDEIYGGR